MAQSNDADMTVTPTVPGAAVEANGQAALLLAESILHALIEVEVLTPAQAVAVVRIAGSTDVASAALIDPATGKPQAPIDLLARLERSLEADVPPVARER